MGEALPTDIDIAFVEVGVSGPVNRQLEETAALAVLTIIATNPSAKVCVTVGGWDDDERAVWEIPEARECVQRFAGRVLLERWPFEAVWQHFHEETIFALIKSGAWEPDRPVRLVEVPEGPVGHA